METPPENILRGLNTFLGSSTKGISKCVTKFPHESVLNADDLGNMSHTAFL